MDEEAHGGKMKKIDWHDRYTVVLEHWKKAQEACRKMSEAKTLAELERDEARKIVQMRPERIVEVGPHLTEWLSVIVAGLILIWTIYGGMYLHEAHRCNTALETSVGLWKKTLSQVSDTLYVNKAIEESHIKSMEAWRSKSMRAYTALKRHHNQEALRILDE
jgi:hypothetical protein